MLCDSGIILNPIESGIHRLSAVIEQESPLVRRPLIWREWTLSRATDPFLLACLLQAMKTTGVPQCQGELELYTELLDLLRQHSKKVPVEHSRSRSERN